VAERDNRELLIQRLLDELCVKLGFCLSPSDQRRLRTAPPLDPDRFTDAVFQAEGMDPRLYGQPRRQVRRTVDVHMRRWTGAGLPEQLGGEPG
jgi:hypothetical protein